MAVRTKRLWDRVAVNAGQVTLYTVPAGETGLVKRIFVSNPSLTTSTVLYIGRPVPGPGGTGNLVKLTVPPDDVVEFETWLVLQPGNPLNAICTVATGVRCSGMGAELEGVAD